MTPTIPEPEPTPKGENESLSMADELRQESERLRQLADKLKKQEESLAEMQANYPAFRQFVYAKLREYFEKTLEPLPDNVDLEAYAIEHDAQPLEAFIDEIDCLAEKP